LQKKKQKNSCPVGLGTAVVIARKDQKFFGSFFQKRTACLSSLLIFLTSPRFRVLLTYRESGMKPRR
jgi:hypothetical protein